MAKWIGRRINVGLALENIRGAAQAPVFLLPDVDLSFDDMVTKVRSVSAIGRIESSEEAFVTTKFGEGEITGEIRSESFGALLYALLGDYTPDASPDGSAYTNAFAIKQSNQHQSMTLVVDDPNTKEAYALTMIDSLEIKAALDEVVKYTVGFKSLTKAGSVFEMPTLTHEAKFTKKHVTVKIATDIAGLGAAVALPAKSLTLSFNKNVMLDDILGDVDPEDILNQQLEITGELMLDYQDETFKDYMLDNAFRALEIKFTNSDELIDDSIPYSLTFQFPYVDFEDWKPNYALDDIVTQTIKFTANVDVANSLDAVSTCELVNKVDDYTPAVS